MRYTEIYIISECIISAGIARVFDVWFESILLQLKFSSIRMIYTMENNPTEAVCKIFFPIDTRESSI